MLIALITDLHFDLRGGSQYFLDKYREFFEKQFFPYLKQHNITTVLIGGDTWENRKSITVNALHHAKDMFFDKLLENDITVYSILGNHDVVFKNTNTINSMNFIEDTYSNFNLVYTNSVLTFDDVKIGLVSWLTKDNYDNQIDFIKTTDCNYLLGHFEINGFELTKGHYHENGLQQSLFKGFDEVWSGHFHIRNKIGNIQYLGNPFQTNRGDIGYDRGFSVFDTDTKSLTFIKNEYNIYDSIHYNNDIDITTFNFNGYTNKIVIVYVYSLMDTNSDLLNLFIDKLNKVAYKVEVEETKTLNINNVSIDDIDVKSHTDIIIEYVDNVLEDTTNLNDVKNIMLERYNECLNIEV